MLIMNPRCKTCPNLCKRLDSGEELPVYDFARLTIRDVLALLPDILTEYEFWRLDIMKQPQGADSDLNILLKPKVKTVQEPWLTVKAGDRSSGGSTLIFQFQVPEQFCDHSPIVTELSNLVRHSVDVLSYTDRLLDS